MRTLRYIFLPVLILLACACQRELDLVEPERPEEGDGTKVTVSFSVAGNFKEYDSWSENEVGTKAFGEMTNAKRNSLKLRVYVFDQYGFFLEKADAEVSNPQPTTIDPDNTPVAVDEETVFSVELTQSMNERRLHFVAIDPGADFNEAYSYGSEGTYMRGVTVSNDVDAYWARETVSQITEGTHFYKVPLLRNFAKFTVSSGATLSNFELLEFALVNIPKSGSVAPFNTYNGGFAKFYTRTGSLVDPSSTFTMNTYHDLHDTQGFYGYRPLEVEWKDTTPAENATGDAGLHFVSVGTPSALNPLYMYESPNADGADRGKTYIIIKGNYTDPNPPHQTSLGYYKVDIMFKDKEGYDPNMQTGVSTYYNILRNFHFQISIDGVSFKGYSSAGEAANKPATNNISASILAEGVNNVSDGNGRRRLFVSDTYLMYNEDGAKEDLLAKAITVAGANQNGNLKLKVLSDPNGILSNLSVDTGTTLAENYCPVHFTLTGLNPEVPKTATLRIYISELEGSETLFRDVTIVLRKKYDLKVDCTDVVPSTANSTVVADLLVPDGINKNMFPLDFTLEPLSKTVYPNSNLNQLPVNVGKSILPGQGNENSFQFIKTLDYNTYSGATVKTVNGNRYRVIPCHFKTNTSVSATDIYAHNQYFELAHDSFLNGNPVFEDGDLAKVTIYPSDYYGAGNSYNYVVFKTVRATGTVNITLTEAGVATTMSNFNLASNTYRSGPVGGVYTYKVPFLTKTFKGSSYSATVEYPNDGSFGQTIQGSATMERRYLFLPEGSFVLTNLGVSPYASSERFKTGIIYGPIATTDPSNTGRIGFDLNGTTEIDGRVSPEFADYGEGFVHSGGYHIGVFRSTVFSSLEESWKFRIYHPTSGTNNAPEDGSHTWREDWYVEVSIGEICSRHALDFQADHASPAQAHPSGGLDKWEITLHAPVSGYDY